MHTDSNIYQWEIGCGDYKTRADDYVQRSKAIHKKERKKKQVVFVLYAAFSGGLFLALLSLASYIKI